MVIWVISYIQIVVKMYAKKMMNWPQHKDENKNAFVESPFQKCIKESRIIEKKHQLQKL